MLEQLAADTDSKDRGQWLRQLADTVGLAVQSGAYPGGVDRLKALHEKLAANEADQELAAYVKFRYLSAEYGQSLQGADPNFADIQAKWLETLEKFVTDYPNSPDSAEAMLQLAIAQEFAGQEEKAKTWYSQILDRFKDAPPARKATGAMTRLNSVGKPIQLSGRTLKNEAVDLAKYKGKVVLIHYWATWCEPCKADMAQLKELRLKYGKGGFELIGVSLDDNDKLLADYLQKNPLPWPQLYEAGGLDSRLANELGVLTLPTMLLIDSKGLVVNRGLHITELDAELKTLIK